MPAKKSPARPSARELLFGDLWEFDPAPESAPAYIEPRYGLFIGGKMVAPKSKKYFDTISPRDGKKLSENMKNAGVDLTISFYKEMVHGFMHMGELLEEVQSVVDEIAAFASHNFKSNI